MRAIATLTRLAKSEAQTRQRALAAVLAEQTRLEAMIAARDAELAAEAQGGAGFAAFAARIRVERRRLAAALADLVAQEAALRADLADAFVELKKLEALAASAEARAQADLTRQESVLLDEIAARRSR